MARSDGDAYPPPVVMPAHTLLASILRYDRTLTSYKFALLRALNDLALAYPDVSLAAAPVAVPVRSIAQQWLASYWPFADPAAPVYQGPRATREGVLRDDVAFRRPLTDLRRLWAETVGAARPADGAFLVNELGRARARATYPAALVAGYDAAVRAIARSVAYPVQYAGPGTWSVFPRPVPFASVAATHVPLPGTTPGDVCVLVSAELWRTLVELSPWVEALCVHQWSLFVEGVDQGDGRHLDRGVAYRLLTDRPENRRPLTWERNQVELLMLEGETFRCPWTGRALRGARDYDLDHIVPVAVYPVNELWNLVPADTSFNQRRKRDRLPSDARLAAAEPALAATYASYGRSDTLGGALRADAAARFALEAGDARHRRFGVAVAGAVGRFVRRVRDGRGVPVFE